MKLPPLPVENFVDKDGLWDEKYGPYSADEMQSYAKLAVRQALERVEKMCQQSISTGAPELWQLPVGVRAIIKEYE